MRYIIDRFEGSLAVCEDEGRVMTDIPRELLPPEAKAGDVLEEIDGVYSINLAATGERKQLIRKKMMDLFE